MHSHVVFGGAGFLGRHVARALADAGASATCVDREAYPGGGAVTSIRADVFAASAAQLDRWVADADVVHHYVWSTVPASADRDPATDVTENLAFTVRLLEALKRRGAARLVFASSGGAVYGRTGDRPVVEDEPPRPLGMYGTGKAAAELYIGAFARAGGVDARVARIANAYGAGQPLHRAQGAATTFVSKALAGEPIEIWGDGSVVRDYVHIEDIVRGLTALARANLPGGEPTIVNIGSGEGVSLNAVVEAVEQAVGWSLQVTRTAPRAFDVPRNVLDVERAGLLLDWRPGVGIRQGLRAVVRDLRVDPTRLFSDPV